MPTMIAKDVHLEIPEWVTNHAAFRKWTDEPDFPEKGNIWWLRGGVWADMSQEQIYSHVDVKGQIFAALNGVVRSSDLGRIFTDGILVTNVDAGWSGSPDATYFSHEAIEEGRVVLHPGKIHGWTEAEGSPDMVLEVVSDSSEDKDFNLLRDDYFAAGVREYWLVDARKTPPTLEILRRGPKEFVASRRQGGWIKSTVFGQSFRLIEEKDRSGFPTYSLEVK